MLKKYPVTGELGSYKVSVINEYVCLGLHQWIVKVYWRNENKRFFKDKLVYTYETGWSNHKELTGKYVQLAQEAVNEYEDIIREDEQLELLHEQGVKEFENWNGIIK